MFDKDKVYWFVLKGRLGDKEFRLKGRVIEENAFMAKIEQDSGRTEIIPLTRIIDVNEAKNTEFKPSVKLNES